jgi:hypothetical protein
VIEVSFESRFKRVAFNSSFLPERSCAGSVVEVLAGAVAVVVVDAGALVVVLVDVVVLVLLLVVVGANVVVLVELVVDEVVDVLLVVDVVVVVGGGIASSHPRSNPAPSGRESPSMSVVTPTPGPASIAAEPACR